MSATNIADQSGGPEVRLRTWIAASEAEARSGLCGYVSVFFGSLILDGIVVRRTADGRTALSFPARTDRSGKRHSYIRPIDNTAREVIERELLGQLAREGVNP
jgi:hypothetical protein